MESLHLMWHSTRGLPIGPHCRRCAQPIARSDHFGLSERLCSPCRGEDRGRPERLG
jgi:hypothetical protein